jgi:hypothetical protein
LVIERAFHIGALGRHQSNLTADYKFPKLVLLAYTVQNAYFLIIEYKPELELTDPCSRWTLMNAIFSLSILGVAGFVTIATGCSLWLGSLHR